jgi:hypothetical protein
LWLVSPAAKKFRPCGVSDTDRRQKVYLRASRRDIRRCVGLPLRITSRPWRPPHHHATSADCDPRLRDRIDTRSRDRTPPVFDHGARQWRPSEHRHRIAPQTGGDEIEAPRNSIEGRGGRESGACVPRTRYHDHERARGPRPAPCEAVAGRDRECAGQTTAVSMRAISIGDVRDLVQFDSAARSAFQTGSSS